MPSVDGAANGMMRLGEELCQVWWPQPPCWSPGRPSSSAHTAQQWRKCTKNGHRAHAGAQNMGPSALDRRAAARRSRPRTPRRPPRRRAWQQPLVGDPLARAFTAAFTPTSGCCHAGDVSVAGACADGSAQLIDATTTSDTSDELWVAARATGRDSRANLRQNWLIRQSCLTPITKHEEWSALPR